MNLPDHEEIEQLWDEYHVPEIIRNHSRAVTKVAVFIAKKLKEKGIHVDVGLVERSCLLHDLTRSANFEHFGKPGEFDADDIEFWKQMKEKYGDVHHAESAADILREKYPEIAQVVGSHGYESKLKGFEGFTWEMKIINYADYRVVHDKIVPLKVRFDDLNKRHKDYLEKTKKETGVDIGKEVEKVTIELEKEIFGIIDAKPEDINEIE